MNRTQKMMTGVLTLLVSTTTACSTHTGGQENYSIEEPSITTTYQESDITPAGEDVFPAEEETLIEYDGSTEEWSIETEQEDEEEYNEELPVEPPLDSDCSYWEWDEETEAYYCEDTNSSYANHYFHGGHYYANQHALMNSSSYQSSKNRVQSSNPSSSSTYKSGIGSGTTGGFGG